MEDLNIENLCVLELSNIFPYEKNIKKHSQEQIDLLVKNISEVGYTQPIVVDKDNIIIAGHGRYEALKKMGIKKIAVVKLDNITPEQAKAQRILDNKVNESPYDLSNLQIELKDLKNEGFDVGSLGFSNFELANFGINLFEESMNTQQSQNNSVFGGEEENNDELPDFPTLPSLPQNIVGNQAGKKPITFFCDDEQYKILQPIFATSKKWEANTQLLIEMVTGK